MRNINRVTLIGNIARAPEEKTTTSGQTMASFVLATNRSWKSPTGGKQNQAEFHNLVAWGKIADICQRFLQKSTLVYIEGYLKTRNWENEEGQRCYRTEIIVQDVLVLGRGIRHDQEETQDASQEKEDHFFSETAEKKHPINILAKREEKEDSIFQHESPFAFKGETPHSSTKTKEDPLSDPPFDDFLFVEEQK